MRPSAPILYWFPGQLDVPADLKPRFERGSSMARNACGPVDQKRGCLISPLSGELAVYRELLQRWREVRPGVWIGVTGQLDPQEILRSKVYPGTSVRLADGNDWVIPVANPLAESCSLPFWEVLVRGQWVREVHDQFVELSQRATDLAGRCRRAVLSGDNPDLSMPQEDFRQLVADVIAVNYDVTLEELSVMNVFAPDMYWPVISAFIDWPAMLRLITADIEEAGDTTNPFAATPATPSTSPGAADSANTTAPPAPTSG